MGEFNPRYLILHDYGVPEGRTLSQTAPNPYHALVHPDGSISYRNPSNPYGQKAPHAHKLNPEAIGLSYAGPVGGQPTPDAMRRIKQEYDAINKQFPGIQTLSHGEAYAKTRGTNQQASRDGRGLDEASWRHGLMAQEAQTPQTSPSLLGTAEMQTGGVTTTAPQQTGPAYMQPASLQSRSLTAGHPGLQQAQYVPPQGQKAPPFNVQKVPTQNYGLAHGMPDMESETGRGWGQNAERAINRGPAYPDHYDDRFDPPGTQTQPPALIQGPTPEPRPQPQQQQAVATPTPLDLMNKKRPLNNVGDGFSSAGSSIAEGIKARNTNGPAAWGQPMGVGGPQEQQQAQPKMPMLGDIFKNHQPAEWVDGFQMGKGALFKDGSFMPWRGA